MYFLLFILLIISARYLLRKFYHVDEIFKKIENVDQTLCNLAMYFATVRRPHICENINYYYYFCSENEYLHYREEYKYLKKLSDFLLEIQHPFQKFLMTADEKEKYSKVFNDLKQTEQSLIKAKKSYEEAEKNL